MYQTYHRPEKPTRIHNMLSTVVNTFGNSHFVNRASAHGCKADMANIQKERKILNVDGYTKQSEHGSQPRCDFVVFFCSKNSNKIVCVLIELKRGKLDADEVSKQLQGTARMIEALLTGFSLVLIPVAITGSSKIDQEVKLRKRTIEFKNLRYRIRYQRCNVPGNLFMAVKDTIA